jgi:putative ABC transport system ATP-binding protein/lipoprotein-releasing system ATP-binding protein
MIECKNVIKEFGSPPQRILHDLSFTVPDGQFLSISGRSGSGKSTLLYIISTLDLPSKGEVFIQGKNIAKMNTEEIHLFRNKHVGFIFQFHYLLPELTALENVLLPAMNLGLETQKQHDAEELLTHLGINRLKHKYPGQLSGGEQQRVAIARALILDPKYIFADEPTGNLDTGNAKVVMEMLKKVNKERRTTICLVTHEPSFAAMAQREIFLIDGKISQDRLI